MGSDGVHPPIQCLEPFASSRTVPALPGADRWLVVFVLSVGCAEVVGERSFSLDDDAEPGWKWLQLYSGGSGQVLDPREPRLWRGSILMQVQVKDGASHDIESGGPLYRELPGSLGEQEPAEEPFYLQACALTATDILRGKWHITLQWGEFEWRTPTAVSTEDGGICYFLQELKRVDQWVDTYPDPKFPSVEGDSEIPDVLVYLDAEGGISKSRRAFMRLSYQQVLERSQEPEWCMFNWTDQKWDKTLPMPKLRLGVAAAPKNHPKWQQARERMAAFERVSELEKLKTCPYELRLHIFAARGLALPKEENPDPFAEDLPDAYVRLDYYGQKVQTEPVPDSDNPSFFQTLKLRVHAPSISARRPISSLRSGTATTSKTICSAWCARTSARGCSAPPTTPKIAERPTGFAWNPLFQREYGAPRFPAHKSNCPELLFRLEVIRLDSIDQPLPEPPKLMPELVPATVEIVALGLRGVKHGSGVLHPQKPYLKFTASNPGFKAATISGETKLTLVGPVTIQPQLSGGDQAGRAHPKTVGPAHRAANRRGDARLANGRALQHDHRPLHHRPEHPLVRWPIWRRGGCDDLRVRVLVDPGRDLAQSGGERLPKRSTQLVRHALSANDQGSGPSARSRVDVDHRLGGRR